MDSSSNSLLLSMCRAQISRRPEKRGRVCGCSGFVAPRAAIKPPYSATGDWKMRNLSDYGLGGQSEAVDEEDALEGMWYGKLRLREDSGKGQRGKEEKRKRILPPLFIHFVLSSSHCLSFSQHLGVCLLSCPVFLPFLSFLH